MTRTRKRWLGVLSVWPLTYVFVFVVGINALNPKQYVGPAPPHELPAWFIGLIGLHIATILLGWAVLILCLIYLFRRADLKGWTKAAWLALLLFGNIVAMPFFVWLHVRADADTRGSTAADRSRMEGAA
jgi:hypothetical protein